MRRIGFYLLLTVLLAACSSAPLRTSSGTSNSGSAYSTSKPRPAPSPAESGLPEFVDHSVGTEEISIEAMSLVGVPYRWGGNTPESGFDCSGLVDYVVRRAASVNLPRTTEQMGGVGSTISPDEIAPGDLIFFNTTGRAHSHVGIYVGQYRFVNAPSTGGTVRLDYVTNPYWAKRFDGIRRVATGLAPKRENPSFVAPTFEAAQPPLPAPTTIPAATDPIAQFAVAPIGSPDAARDGTTAADIFHANPAPAPPLPANTESSSVPGQPSPAQASQPSSDADPIAHFSASSF
jgi:hypothetical protein